MSARAAWELTKETFSEWLDDKASRLAAALAYYTLFSLAPLLIIAIGIAGLVFGEEAARGQVMVQLAGLIGEKGAAFLQELLAASRGKSHGIAATVIGLAVLLFGAAGVFGQLQDALNTIWEVRAKPGRGWRGVLRDRFLSFAMVLGTGFLLLTSLALTAVFAAVGKYLSDVLPIPAAALEAVNLGVSFCLTSFLFALIFKMVPDARIAWRDVWLGAALTALLFSLGKFGIGLYLGKSTVASTFGAAASPVVLMVWIYYSAQILFLGAEFTQVYARRHGSQIRPSKNAVLVTERLGDEPEGAERPSS